MLPKILITGGAGFIGKKLALKLSVGNEIHILDNLNPQIHGINPDISWMKECGIRFHFGDINDIATICDGLEFNIVYHLASETGTGQSMYEIRNYCHTNVQGTAVLLDFLSNSNPSQIILSSSRSIYGEGSYLCKTCDCKPDKILRKNSDMDEGVFDPRCQICMKELYPIATEEGVFANPISIYASNKKTQEELISLWSSSRHTSCKILRFQNVFGPGQSLSNPYTGILSIFSKLLLANKPINIFEDGDESRDFIYIDDVVNTLITIKNIDEKLLVTNVGTGIQTSVLKVAETLKDNFSSKSQLNISGDYRLGDIRHNFADTKKLNQYIDVSKFVGFEKGVFEFVKCVKETDMSLDDSYENSLDELRKSGLLK